MDEKSLQVLEYHKVLSQLAAHCAFSASAEMAEALRPVVDYPEVVRMQAQTKEARVLLESSPGTGVGGARDVRPQVEAAARGGVLLPTDLLDIKGTLVSARTLGRLLDRHRGDYPQLAELADVFPQPTGLVDAITRTVSDRGEVLDSASEKLRAVRAELRQVHERLLSRLQRMVSSPNVAPYLQENIVTQRDGRYVIPLRAEFKGKVKAIVHDQSASGATLFIEPISVVDQNNRYRELQLAERDEERRVLAEISGRIGAHSADLSSVVSTLASLDLVFAKAQYADQLEATEPILHPLGNPTSPDVRQATTSPSTIMRLIQARHPLLAADIVVPIDIVLDPGIFAMVITGPNTGGKTVTLKTAGLLVLMAQSGLAIPAHPGSELSIFDGIFADIGDEQSIEQSLSTFSAHITTIVRLLDTAGPQSLVVLDELGAGTDPQEGAALAMAILEHLITRPVTTLVATHYPELKMFAHASSGVVNASMEFDLETLSPTYHLVVGLPGRSNAIAIARRLGLDEQILEQASGQLSPADLQVEDLLDEIHRQRDLLRQARSDADQALAELREQQNELRERLDNIEEERRKVIEQARGEAEREIEDLQTELRTARRNLAKARQPLDAIEPIQERLDELAEEAEAPVERLQPEAPEIFPIEPQKIRLGDRVRLRTLGAEGVVGAIGQGEAEVHVGSMRIRAHLTDLELVAAGASTATGLSGSVSSSASSGGSAQAGILTAQSPGLELHLRGKRIDDALEELDAYLDAAFLAGIPYARIVHGKGTGKLRDAVRQVLSKHPHVKSFEPGAPNEGGGGVTMVRFI